MALTLSACVTEARASARPAAFEFRPGVIVDGDRRVAYAMNPRGGVDAIDLLTGRVRWTSAGAGKPLLLAGATLVSQADEAGDDRRLRFLFLDVARRGAIVGKASVELPEGVRASIDDEAAASFRLTAWPVPRGFAYSWTHSEVPLGGARDETPERRVEGSGAVELGTGKVSPAPPGTRAEPPRDRPPPKLEKMQGSGRIAGALWRAGEGWVAVARRGGASGRTVLQRWSSRGDSLPDAPLFTNGYTVRYPSADGRHLLVSRLEPARSKTTEPYRWLVFALPGGARVATLDLEFPAAWFFVTGPLLLHEVQARNHLADPSRPGEPRKIRAIDLRTGVERWSLPLRDTVYRGPPPPPLVETMERRNQP